MLCFDMAPVCFEDDHEVTKCSQTLSQYHQVLLDVWQWRQRLPWSHAASQHHQTTSFVFITLIEMTYCPTYTPNSLCSIFKNGSKTKIDNFGNTVIWGDYVMLSNDLCSHDRNHFVWLGVTLPVCVWYLLHDLPFVHLSLWRLIWGGTWGW